MLSESEAKEILVVWQMAVLVSPESDDGLFLIQSSPPLLSLRFHRDNSLFLSSS